MEKSKFNQYVELLSVFYQNDFKTMIMGVENGHLSDQKGRFHRGAENQRAKGPPRQGRAGPSISSPSRTTLGTHASASGRKCRPPFRPQMRSFNTV